jgi:hypothetical protein
MRQRQLRQEADEAIRDLPSVTGDGVEVSLNINAGLLIDLPQLSTTGAAGIGLYRTEIPFMMAHEFPSVARQAGSRPGADIAGGKPFSARSTSAPTRCFPTGIAIRKRIRPWAGGRSASRSTGRTSCASNCAPCWLPPPVERSG